MKREPRLQFSDADLAEPKLEKPIKRVKKAEAKADKAQAKIPKKTVVKKERGFDPATGKVKTQLRFEEVDKKKPPSKLTHIMFNRKSSYALNKKDPNAIVYMDANEAIIRLTREDFASEEEFLKWKSLSDADYHASEKEDHVYANHTLALDELSEEAASIPAADICMEQAHDRVAEIRRSTQKVTQIRKHLTDTQFRRMWMYFVDGMTIDEIGKVEGVSHQAISLNITAAIRKIKKYF